MTDTFTRTFRLQGKTINKLEAIAKQEKINANQLVSNLLDDYTTWHYKANGIGFIEFPKMLLQQIFETMSDTEIDKIAVEHANQNVADIISYTENEFTEQTFLAVIEKWATTNRIQFQKIEESDLKYVINLGMGKNFSRFFSRFVKEVIENFKESKVDSTINGNTIEFTLKPTNQLPKF